MISQEKEKNLAHQMERGSKKFRESSIP